MERKSYSPKTSLKDYVSKTGELLFGLLLFGLGSYLTVQANIGLPPWWAFDMGLSRVTGIDYGIVHNGVAFAIILVDLLIREKIGWGMIGDALIVGAVVSVCNRFGLLPPMGGWISGILCMVVGLFVIAVGSFFYMDAGFGAGPRDALMVALCRALHRLSVGTVRILLEGSALLVGWLLGAKVGLGTLVYMFGMGLAIEIVFRIARFDATRVKNESLLDTHRNLFRLLKEKTSESSKTSG